MFSGKYDLLNESVAQMLESAVGGVEIAETPVPSAELLVSVGAAKSKAEARRLIEQRAVSLNGLPVIDAATPAHGLSAAGFGILSVGKHRRFVVRRRNRERTAAAT